MVSETKSVKLDENSNNKRIMVELKIPSEFGYEKIAMSTVATIASEFGFNEEKVEDIKTAVSEACINAIEHGNQMLESKNVLVLFRVTKDGLIIDVQDEGRTKGFKLVHSPDLENKMAGASTKRGWGLFLIDKLVDDVKVIQDDDNASVLRMVIKLEQNK